MKSILFLMLAWMMFACAEVKASSDSTEDLMEIIRDSRDAESPEQKSKSDALYKEKKKNEAIVLGLMDAAFSHSMWGNSMGHQFSKYMKDMPIDRQGRLEKNVPYLAEYVIRREGLPTFGTLHKWSNRQISVGLDWPVAGMPSWKNNIQKREKYISAISPYVLKSIELINREDIVDLNFIAPTEEVPNHFANIRVVPLGWLEAGKSRISGEAAPYGEDIISLERSIKAGVRFSSGNVNQVEGFLLPRADNNIGVSVCYINMNEGKSIIQSHVDECIFRSLGLPEIVKAGEGILSERKTNKSVTVINQEDFNILRRLYSDDLKSGADKYHVLYNLSVSITE